MGAPVTSFCRIDDKPIRTHEPVTDPDALVIQDPTLLHQADLFAGLRPGGYVLLNSTRSFGELGLDEFAARRDSDRLRSLPAANLAMAHLGRPLPGAPMLGGLAALTGVVSLNAVLAAVRADQVLPDRQLRGREPAAARGPAQRAVKRRPRQHAHLRPPGLPGLRRGARRALRA
jgi:pyruvate ferredoxin oxidoreductase gamma subunit